MTDKELDHANEVRRERDYYLTRQSNLERLREEKDEKRVVVFQSDGQSWTAGFHPWNEEYDVEIVLTLINVAIHFCKVRIAKLEEEFGKL